MNIVYNEVLVYRNGKKEYVNSNIAKYDVHPWHTGNYSNRQDLEKYLGISLPYEMTGDEDNELLNKLVVFQSQSLECFLDHNYQRHKRYTVDELEGIDINYLYPVIIYSNEIFKKYDSIDIPERVLNDAVNNKCKICFIQPTEGFFGENDQNFVWMDSLSKKYNLSRDSLVVITTNFRSKLRQQELIELGYIGKNTFKVIEYSYFAANLWFHDPGHISDSHADINGRIKIADLVSHNLTQKKKFHFLNFNRVPKLHRAILYGVLNSKKTFQGKFISTIAGTDSGDPQYYKKWVEGQVPTEYDSRWRLDMVKFYSNYDSTQHATYDVVDLENNKADSLNLQAHKESFVNIVSESLIHPETIFFSEKIYKPIFCIQPFIIVGNPDSLKSLKEQGFRTFDKWWDESYDNEIDFHRRMDKIIGTMEEISKWSLEKCYKITQEMLPDLIHNFNVLMKGETLTNLLDELSVFKNKAGKDLI